MTQFKKENFNWDGMYLTYNLNETCNRLFVARFKCHAPGKNKTAFQKFLIAHFTVEEYFEMQKSGGMSPTPILETKGYVSPNLQAALKAMPALAITNSIIAAILQRRA